MSIGKRRKGMLILTRNQGESLNIGEAVTVTVLGTKGGQVRLGIQAPKQIKVLRSELLDRPHSERHTDPPETDSDE
jgi:carbon storage regulator